MPSASDRRFPARGFDPIEIPGSILKTITVPESTTAESLPDTARFRWTSTGAIGVCGHVAFRTGAGSQCVIPLPGPSGTTSPTSLPSPDL
jgi:hypothetical protein